MRHPISTGRTYWVTVKNDRVRVRTIRLLPNLLPLSWECEVIHDGRIVVVPATDDWNFEPLTVKRPSAVQPEI